MSNPFDEIGPLDLAPDCDMQAELTCQAIDMRDLLDEITYDLDVPPYRRNQARQAVADFDRALSGDDAA